MILPIWKDHYINLGTADIVRYRVVCDGVELFNGNAYKKPGATNVRVRVNDICADAFDTGTTQGTSEIVKAFSLDTYNGSGWEIGVAAWNFAWDWSYKSHSISGMANDFILPYFDRNQQVCISCYGEGLDSAWLGTEENPQDIPLGDYSEAGHTVAALWEYPECDRVTFEDNGGYTHVYPIVDTCSRFVLNYLNAWGGWDSLLLRGVVRKTDNYQRTTIGVEYDNADNHNRGEVDLRNEVVRTFVCVSGWMSNEQSQKMHHLLGSTNVLLTDMVDRVSVPVIITDTACDYKTDKTEGKPVCYTITAKLAANMERR